VTLERPELQDFVIIGATGDLARRKLFPALWNLFRQNLLPEICSIICAARRPMDDETMREHARNAVLDFAPDDYDAGLWPEFSSHIGYVQLTPEGYDQLQHQCHQADRVFYLATPPDQVAAIAARLHKHGLHEGAKIVIEKPFGLDAESARRLNALLHEGFDESQVYRIDHYLGKETVQNILVFRFANSVFERIWNRDAIEHIQVTVAESIGIEGRGSFYDQVGALRDIVQNHVLQMLAVLTMEPPSSFEPERIRDEKAKLLAAVRPIDPRRVVRGQYTDGVVQGKEVPAYTQEAEVAPASTTETFVALELFIDNWRWAGVPVYLRTGKRLPYRATEMEIAFKDTPIDYLESATRLLHPNHLIYRIQPDEALSFRLLTKRPGPSMVVDQTDMRFDYRGGFMVEPAEAYERLIYDVMNGDQTLFVREDAVTRAWEVIQPILNEPTPVFTYAAGTWGPSEADQLLAPHRWHLR
jgi:glucose-6-phosphate 1-dehydrogenase